ncbi:hypothetical protein [Trinickia dabaoshanensis]|uniref:hypothetical protein n=1 Tax=Trinickia dabaoshanensis TaxID=564714 RepID=UPI0011AF2AC9|nr:hypothetical protein [Trinickia dabaoshanensis]
MDTGVRRRWVACFVALYCLNGAALALAQESERGYGAAGDRALRYAPMQGKANRVEAPGGEPENLLGGPAPAGDLYGTEADAGTGERALTREQRAARYGQAAEQPARAAQPRHVPRLARPGADDEPAGREAKVNRADPGTQSPAQSALSIYHGPGDVGKAVGQVYRMPW